VLVLAGDIAKGADAVERFARWPVPVIYVHGNHEAYGMKYDTLADSIRVRAAGTAVHYLERQALIVGDVRFLGCCPWTDYALSGTRERSMVLAGRMLHDHRVIRTSEGGRFRPAHALAGHENALGCLRDQFAEPFDGRAVVVTHHGVAPPSVHPRFVDDPVTPAFVSDLRPLLRLADVWIHGHVHDPVGYRAGQTRVIANPRGHATNRLVAGAPAKLEWENPAFDPALVIEP
jgi:predicted phosphodiesterase